MKRFDIFTAALPILASLMLVSCDSGKPTSTPTENGTQKGSSTSGTAQATESEARAVLKAALESWSFGDSADDFKGKRPDVSVFEPEWSFGHVVGRTLERYEIRSGREYDGDSAETALNAYEFMVSIELKKEGRIETKSRRYKVQKINDGTWMVLENS